MLKTMKSIVCIGISAAMLAATSVALPTAASAETAYGTDGSYQVADNGNRHGQNWKRNGNRHGQNWNGNRNPGWQGNNGNWNGNRPGWNGNRPGPNNNVRVVRPGWNGPGYYQRRGYPGRYYYNDYNSAVAAGIIGLATGAIIAGAASQPRYATNDYVAYCSQRYRSFNPNTGTYTGYDGLQHRCVAP